MSLPLSGFLLPMKHTPTWDMSGNKSKNAEDALIYIKCPYDVPSWLPLRQVLLLEVAAPLLGLIITNIFFFSLPNTVLLSIMTLTSITTLATSTRVLYLFGGGDSSFLRPQQLLQKLLQCSVLFMHGLALVSPSPSPLHHITIPLLTIFFIIWPILIYISRHISPSLKQHLMFPSLPLFFCSVASLFGSVLHSSLRFGSVLHSLLVRPDPWTSYLQLAACVSITLFCKDSVTELESHRISSFIKRVIHLTLCTGTVAYQFYAVFIDPTSANIVSALLVSTHIFFVLFKDTIQDIRHHNIAFVSMQLDELLSWGHSSTSAQQMQEKRKTQLSVAPWYFSTRALLYALLGTHLLFVPLPVQPASVLLKAFFLSQIISNMMDCLLKQMETSKRKRWWNHLIERKIGGKKLKDLHDTWQKAIQIVRSF